MNQRGDAPISVIKRLPVYLRVLDNLVKRDIEVVSSKTLSKETGFTAEQIRKDLAFFGAFGTRGTGYNTNYLRERVLRIIGLDKQTNVAIAGAGHLGTAFARYNIRENPYTNVVGLFDVSPDIVGDEIEGVTVYHLNDLQDIVREKCVQVGVITVPAVHAQEVVDRMVEEGVKAILNFAPAKLGAPDDVRIHNVDLTIELQSLIYFARDELCENGTQDLE